jgi:serine-type D-Ala-D-Ala carboxypeptidase/endopeptidase
MVQKYLFSFGNMSKVNNIPVDGNTISNTGSITKTSTTLILSDFAKKGIVNLDDSIEKHLPSNIIIPSYKGHKITLENSAAHTSGLAEWPSNIWLNNMQESFKLHCGENHLYEELSNFVLTRKHGSQFQYSSFGIALLAHIFSFKADVPYEQLIKEF